MQSKKDLLEPTDQELSELVSDGEKIPNEQLRVEVPTVPMPEEGKFVETTSNGIALHEPHTQGMTLDLMEKYSRVFIASGMFPDLKSASQGMVKIMAGQELGMTAFSSIKNINIIQGKPELSAGALSALVKSSGRYDYKVKEWDDKHCVIEWYDLKVWGKDPIGVSSFSEEEAKLAGLASKDNWRKFAKAMYFARALSQGVRTYTPDVTSGAIYIQGEISGEVSAIEHTPAEPKPKVDAQGEELPF